MKGGSNELAEGIIATSEIEAEYWPRPNVKIRSAFCDLHPTQKLKVTNMDAGAKVWVLQQRTLGCTSPNCDRQFHYDFGYFAFHVGEEPDFGDLKAKPRCRNDHDLLYMLLTKIDDVLVYACFSPECTSTILYAG